ncbi:Alpha/Beta hydrolase protein [Hyaloraphidium curvatum]|nr:Alpha/Beta hydrolase protein [Hyaloraphidium curvatum]
MRPLTVVAALGALAAITVGVLPRVLSAPPHTAVPRDPEDRRVWTGTMLHGDPGDAKEGTVVDFQLPLGDVDDLKAQLKRWLARAESTVGQDEDGWTGLGAPRASLEKWVRKWLDDYDWPSRRVALQAMGRHVLVRARGLWVHCVVIDPPAANASTPTALLVHGWPGSFVEFAEAGPMLASKGFRVVVASLPGFGPGTRPHRHDFSFVDAARTFIDVLVHLGPHPGGVVTQGGDYGSGVVAAIAQLVAQDAQPAFKLIGTHVNFLFGFEGPWWLGGPLAPAVYFSLGRWIATPDDMDRLTNNGRYKTVGAFYLYILQEMGYFHEQATKPRTIGAALDDSPAGLLAWIVEKFYAWAPPHEQGRDVEARWEHILDDVTLYHVTRTGLSSARYYSANFRDPAAFLLSARAVIPGPAAVADVVGEIVRVPRAFLPNKFPDLRRHTTFPTGGHFFAMHRPAELAGDVEAFVRGL